MHPKKKIQVILLIISLLLILAVAVQAADLAYELPWWTADGGGGDSHSGSYELSATIGQADAGTLQAGAYSLAGGFWSAVPSAPIEITYQVMLPLMLK